MIVLAAAIDVYLLLTPTVLILKVLIFPLSPSPRSTLHLSPPFPPYGLSGSLGSPNIITLGQFIYQDQRSTRGVLQQLVISLTPYINPTLHKSVKGGQAALKSV